MAFFGQFDACGGACRIVGHAHEDACAVAGVFFGAYGPAVVEVDEHFDGVVDDFAFGACCGDHTHAAGVVLGAGIVHTLNHGS